MPPHIKKRRDRSETFYLIDGRLIRSLKTRVRRLAEARLDQYIRGKFDLGPKETLRQYYERWIETKKEPLVRRSLVRDYRQHFGAYLLPELGHLALASIGVGELQRLRAKLLAAGLAPKTVKNVIASSLRAFWKDAMGEQLIDRDPFGALKWPRSSRQPPDPFTAEERELILAEVRARQPFYYPWVYTLFWTGMRPSEAAALRVGDVDLRRGTISITKSRHLGVDAEPKTAGSRRAIAAPREVLEAIGAIRLPWETVESPLFYNKQSAGPLDPNQWARVYWRGILAGAGVRYRKFYSTRHTFITELIARGEVPKAVADYCGTSVAMIERDYCGRLALSYLTEIKPEGAKSLERLVVPTGLEPGAGKGDKVGELIPPRLFERLKRARFG